MAVVAVTVLALAGAACGGSDDEIEGAPRACVTAEEGCENDPIDLGAGSAIELPAGWPTRLGLPAGATVLSAYTSDDPGGMSVVVGVDSDPREVADEVRDQLVEAGFAVDPDADAGDDGERIVASGDDLDVEVTVHGSPEDDGESGATEVSYTFVSR